MIEEMAEKQKILVSLKNMETMIEARVPFKRANKHLYNMFDERARLTIIDEILRQELNFETL